MRHIGSILLLGVTAPIAVAAVESVQSPPRGVGPEFENFYKNKESFTCISHPSVIIKPGQVNDDHCDCPDGSDEPGTSACTHLSPLSPPQPLPNSVSGTTNTTVALPGFYCQNKGHRPEYIPSLYVNDGICDYEVCCDGSDEWAGVGGVKCKDRCAKMGKEWRAKQAELEKAAAAAKEKRQALVTEASKLRKNTEDAISKLEHEIKGLKVKEQEAKKTFEDVERRERGRLIKGGEGKQSRVTILAGLAKQRVEELRDALTATIRRRDETKAKVEKLEAILKTFKEEYNPNFNDEGVKRAVKAWDDYAVAGQPETSAIDESEQDLSAIVKADNEESGINWAEWSEEQESDVEVLYRFENYLPVAVREWLHIKYADLRDFLVANGVLAANQDSSSVAESKAVTVARTTYEGTRDALKKVEDDLGAARSELTNDYGPDDVFRSLSEQCIEQESGEYVYEVCWMSSTTQKSRKGGAHTNLGKFTGFGEAEVDDDDASDGKVTTRLTMKYEGGQGCWNGPARSTKVVLSCAEKDVIYKISELEKCVYQMDAGTPAVCLDYQTDAKGHSIKDEL